MLDFAADRRAILAVPGSSPVEVEVVSAIEADEGRQYVVRAGEELLLVEAQALASVAPQVVVHPAVARLRELAAQAYVTILPRFEPECSARMAVA